MDYETLIGTVGNLGIYQLVMFATLSFTAFMAGIEIALLVLGVQVPNYACLWPEPHSLFNDSLPSTSQLELMKQFFNWSQSLNRDKCTVPIMVTATSNISTPCRVWIYDQSIIKNNMITEFDLVCNKKYYLNFLLMAYYSGQIFGMAINSLADFIGRRKMMLIMCLFETAINIVMAIVPYLEIQLVLRFVRGLASGYFILGLALITELLSKKYRGIFGTLYWIFWFLGMMAAGGFGYIGEDWRVSKLYATIPAVVYLSYFLIVPESPRWLFLRKRKPEAVAVFRRIANWNKIKFDETMFDNVIIKPEPTGRVAELFKHPNTRRKTLSTCVLLWAFCFAYYAIGNDTSFFHSNNYISMVLQGFTEFWGGPLAAVLIVKFGERYTTMVLIAIICFLLMLLPFLLNAGYVMLGNCVGLSAKLVLIAGFCLVDLINAQIHPTSNRSVGLMVVGFTGHTANVLGAFVLRLSEVKFFLPSLIFTVALILSLVLFYLYIPELNEMPLSQTIQQSERLIPGKEKEWSEWMLSENEQIPDLDQTMEIELAIGLNESKA